MTVTYTAQVATSKFACFLTLLTRWRGSIYKLLWKDFLIFAFFYFALQSLYRFVLNDDQKRIFEMISRYCADNNSRIPVAFVLGFFVSLVMSRWWGALTMIPWPDHMAMFVTANVRGLDERGRLMRRTMVRYVCLAYTITMSSISPPVRKRFPTLQHFVEAGLMTANEKVVLDKLRTPHNKFFIPLAWTTALVNRARAEGRIRDDFAVKTLNDEINEVRRQLATLFVYDMMTIPLVYTQVVTIAVHMFFLACLMGRQFLTDDPTKLDLYFPVFTFLEYFFYMGWLKVAECLINPFGEDDDDFDINFLVDRNLQVAYLIVDEMHDEHPDLIRDQYWDDTLCEMPYTTASAHYKQKQAFKGSASDMRVLSTDIIVPTMEAIHEGDDDEEAEAEYTFDLEGGGKGRPVPQRLMSRSKGGGSYSRSESRSSQFGSPARGEGGRYRGGSRRGNLDSQASRSSKALEEETQFSMDPDVDDVVARLDEGIDYSSSLNKDYRQPQSSFKPSISSAGSSQGPRGSTGWGQGSNQPTPTNASPLLLSEPLKLAQSDFSVDGKEKVTTRQDIPTAARRTSLLSGTDDETGDKSQPNDSELGRQSSNVSTASSVQTVIQAGGPRQQGTPSTGAVRQQGTPSGGAWQQTTPPSGGTRQQTTPSTTLYKLSDDEMSEQRARNAEKGGERSPQGGWSPNRDRYNRMGRPTPAAATPATPPSASPKSPVWVSAPGGHRSPDRDQDRPRLPSVPL